METAESRPETKKSEDMGVYKKVLRKAGIVLVAAGLLDIAIGIYCIANGMSYTSSLNFLAIIGGVFLLRGSLKAARFWWWVSAFFLTCCLLIILALPIWSPVGFWIVYLKLFPGRAFITILIYGGVLGLFLWLYKLLRCQVVLDARSEKGLKTAKPIVAFVLGAIFGIGLSSMMVVVNIGEIGQTAIAKAKEQNETDYSYFVTSVRIMNFAGTKNVNAIVVAYNSEEIKQEFIAWSEEQSTIEQ